MPELAAAASAFPTVTIATVDADHFVTRHPLTSPDLISLRCCVYHILFVTPLLHAEPYIASSR